MSESRKCTRCGAELTPDAPGGHCLPCLLLLGVSSETATQPEIARPTTKLHVAEKPPDEAVGRTLGRYKLLEKVGEGGCGVVYVAEQTEPVRRRVAIKVIKLGMDTKQVVARFEAERQALAMMDHPNIAKVLDAGTTGQGRPYFVMELVRGIRITEYCDQNNLATKERLALFIKVCQAIQHAHQKGIIHRDIKPSNILVTLHDGVPVPKVIDFGIAKATEGRLTDLTVYTQLHQFIGTPAYMSPEQAEMSGLDIDTRSDIYSLGVLLYELLSGGTPFDAKELMAAGIDAMRRIIREREPLRPSTRFATLQSDEMTTAAKCRSTDTSKLMNQIRGDLDWIAMKCLEKDRTRRYETANGLAADLKRHLDNEPVLARPPSAAYKFKKAIRRNKLLYGTVAAVVLALVAGLSLASVGWRETLIERDKAIQAKAGEETQRKAAQASAATAQAQRNRADTEKAEARHLLYVAKMNLAQDAWEQNNVGRLRELLDETATNSERGFEWYYWQRQAHLEIKTLRGHSGGISSVAFSPDGRRIVTGSYDKTAKVWDSSSGEEVLTLTGHSHEVDSAAFSPDGQKIVTGSGDKTAKVWSAVTGEELLIIRGHGHPVGSVAFSPDGRRIVTGSGNSWPKSGDGTATVWNAATGKELLTLKGHSAGPTSVAFSPDSQRIVTGGDDEVAKLWDAFSGEELLTLKGHRTPINSVAFSPNGKWIVTGGADETARVWDAASGKEMFQLTGHNGGLNSAAFSPDGRRIVTGGDDQTARVWDTASGKELFTLKGHISTVMSVAFSPDGRRIVTGAGDWESNADKTAKIWEVGDGQELLKLHRESNQISSIAFSPDGQRIVTASADQTARLWDAASGQELLTLEGDSNEVFWAAFSADSQRIIAVDGSNDKTAKVWDAASGRQLLTLRGHDNSIYSASFSPDGQRIVTGSHDQTAKVWDAASGKELLTLNGHVGRVWSVAFSPDSQRIVTGNDDQIAKVWGAANGKELLDLKGHKSIVVSVAFSPDGQRIATGSSDRTAKVWDGVTGQELLTLKGHRDQIWFVAFSPDSRRILTASADSTVKLWDLASGRELLTLKGNAGPVRSAAFSPDGLRIATRSLDKTANMRVWEAASARQVAAWHEEERAAAQSLADRERERDAAAKRELIVRARDSIKQWLILAPIPLPAGQSGTKGLDIEHIEGEARLRPGAGESKSVGNGKLTWRAVALTNEAIDFNTILGRETTQSVAYAVCYIRSDLEQRGLQLLVGSDDESKIFLNGKEIYKSSFVRGLYDERDKVRDITLNAGLNVVVFKVVNETKTWLGAIRFTDAHGNPVKGVNVTLDPDEKNSP